MCISGQYLQLPHMKNDSIYRNLTENLLNSLTEPAINEEYYTIRKTELFASNNYHERTLVLSLIEFQVEMKVVK